MTTQQRLELALALFNSQYLNVDYKRTLAKFLFEQLGLEF